MKCHCKNFLFLLFNAFLWLGASSQTVDTTNQQYLFPTDSINKINKTALNLKNAKRYEESCKILNDLGNYLYEKSAFNESLSTYENALNISKKQANSLISIEIQIGIGKVYIKQGNLSGALTQFVNTLELSEKANNPKFKAESWNQIGIIHWKEGKNIDALSSYKNSLKIMISINDSLGIAELYNNIGIIHKLEKDYTTAYSLYIKSLNIRRALNNKKGIGQSLFNIGSLKAEFGLFKESLDYYKKSLLIKNELHDEYGKLSCYLNMGNTYMVLDNLQEAINELQTGLNLAYNIGAIDFQKSFYRELSLVFEKKNDFEQAYNYHVKYMAIKDTLINISNNNKLAELRTKYNISEKQRNIESLTLEKKLTKEKYNREVYFRNSLMAIIFLILLVVTVILIKDNTLKKINKQLALQKSIVEQREKEKELLVREMHHRVKNNLQLTSSLLNLQARKLTDNEAIQSLKQARDRIHAISLIHQKLYSKDDISQINLNEFLPELSNAVLLSNNSQKTSITIQYNIDDIFITLDIAISIGLIINEALINSVKYAFVNLEKGIIEISAKKEVDLINLSIKDNGLGIQNLENSEQFGGFGFQLLRSFTTKLAGKISIENNQGTIINIKIPLQ